MLSLIVEIICLAGGKLWAPKQGSGGRPEFLRILDPPKSIDRRSDPARSPGAHSEAFRALGIRDRSQLHQA